VHPEKPGEYPRRPEAARPGWRAGAGQTIGGIRVSDRKPVSQEVTMNRIRQIIAAPWHRPPGKEEAKKKRTVTRLTVAITALAVPLIGGLANAGSASAGILPPRSLTLSSNSFDDWVASGTSYTPGLSDVQLWVQDVTNGSWTTLEYQSGLDTSSNTVSCFGHICREYWGGGLSTQGASYYVSPTPGPYSFPGSWQAVHPLQCGHSYQAVTDDPSDGWVYSNILAEPACIIIP
jgi:hypothetical protein